jgi:uncharacterized protein (TIGR02646 family)
MKKINRLPLQPKTLDVLGKRTRKVMAHPSPKGEAARAWAQFDPQRVKADADIKNTLTQMASGLSRCMYCEDSAGTAVEHFWPKAKYPCLTFTWENHLLACSACNNYKQDQFPLHNDAPLLLDPTQDDPAAHLHYLPLMGAFTRRDAKGEATIEVLQLNARPMLRAGRRNAFEKLQLLLAAYDTAKQGADRKGCQRLERVIRAEPFGSMLEWLRQVAQGPLSDYVSAACQQALSRCPEVSGWV